MAHTRTGFRKYFEDATFVDRWTTDAGSSVDVIIPVLHTNELWRANLLSIYREIPVKRLLLGDGGCVDDTIDVARAFPRVQVFDHRAFKSLGFSIRRLIEEVETEWFIYLHSDVYLPEGWFNDMAAARHRYDWFESGQNITVMVQYVAPTIEVERAYSGSQMGRKAAFKDVLPKIDDDYLYRNEDIIFANLIKDAGFRYGKVAEASHDHQVMFKESRWLRRVKRASFELELSHEEEVRAALTYVNGIVKYLHPDRAQDLIGGLHENLYRLTQLKAVEPNEFARWVAKTNPAWCEIFPVVPEEPAAPSVTSEVPAADGPEESGKLDAMAVESEAAAQTSAGGAAPASMGTVASAAGNSAPQHTNECAPAVVARRAPAAPRLPTHEPLALYRPTRVGLAVIYVLSGTDLTLRGYIGPARYLRRWRSRGEPQGAMETRPTLATMKLVKYVDQIACGKRSLRQAGTDVAQRLSAAIRRAKQAFTGRSR
jgi:hypothetical protein